MNISCLTLDELLKVAYDSEDSLAREIAHRIDQEFEESMESAQSRLAEVDGLEAEVTALNLENESLTKQLESTREALSGLQLKVFHISNQEARDFNDDYDFVENSDEVKGFRDKYGPNFPNASAVFAKTWEGGVEEVWITEANDYFSCRANYWRVY